MSFKGWKQRNQGMSDGGGNDYLDIDDDGLAFDPDAGYFRMTGIDFQSLASYARTLPATWDFIHRIGYYDGDYNGVVGEPITTTITGNIINEAKFHSALSAGSGLVYGEYNPTYVAGDLNGFHLYGKYVEMNNRVSTGTATIQGIYATAHAEATASTEAVGVTGAGLKGNLNATPLLIIATGLRWVVLLAHN